MSRKIQHAMWDTAPVPKVYENILTHGTLVSTVWSPVRGQQLHLNILLLLETGLHSFYWYNQVLQMFFKNQTYMESAAIFRHPFSLGNLAHEDFRHRHALSQSRFSQSTKRNCCVPDQGSFICHRVLAISTRIKMFLNSLFYPVVNQFKNSSISHWKS